MACEVCGSKATGPCDVSLYNEICFVCCQECNYCKEWNEETKP